MNLWIKLIATITVVLLTSCSAQQINIQENKASVIEPEKQPQQDDHFADYDDSLNPPLTITKDNKKLTLVKIMDGGMCKNKLQGARGSFLVYADANDIERIKRDKPQGIFNEFETKIQNFSSEAFEKAIEKTNLSIDPFSLGDDVMQQKLAEQLINNFRIAAEPSLTSFKKETTLTINVIPFSRSFIFYQEGCDISRNDYRE